MDDGAPDRARHRRVIGELASLVRRALDAEGAVDIHNGTGGSMTGPRLGHLLELLGVGESDELVAGWWNGWNDIAEYRATLGEPIGTLTVEEQTELDWTLWVALPHQVIGTTVLRHQSPGILLRRFEPTFVLLTAPTSFTSELHLVARGPSTP